MFTKVTPSNFFFSRTSQKKERKCLLRNSLHYSILLALIAFETIFLSSILIPDHVIEP